MMHPAGIMDRFEARCRLWNVAVCVARPPSGSDATFYDVSVSRDDRRVVLAGLMDGSQSATHPEIETAAGGPEAFIRRMCNAAAVCELAGIAIWAGALDVPPQILPPAEAARTCYYRRDFIEALRWTLRDSECIDGLLEVAYDAEHVAEIHDQRRPIKGEISEANYLPRWGPGAADQGDQSEGED